MRLNGTFFTNARSSSCRILLSLRCLSHFIVCADWISNTVMAKQGFARMGFSACFGGPYFSILFLLHVRAAANVMTILILHHCRTIIKPWKEKRSVYHRGVVYTNSPILGFPSFSSHILLRIIINLADLYAYEFDQSAEDEHVLWAIIRTLIIAYVFV